MSDLLRKAFRLGFEASGEGYNGEYPFEGYNVDEDEEWCEMRDEALARLAAPVAAPVQVKALEWTNEIEMQGIGDTSEWRANPFSGMIKYCVVKWYTDGHFSWYSGNEFRSNANTLEAAKAAAQADYEQRIRSALISGDTSNG